MYKKHIFRILDILSDNTKKVKGEFRLRWGKRKRESKCSGFNWKINGVAQNFAEASNIKSCVKNE